MSVNVHKKGTTFGLSEKYKKVQTLRFALT